MNKGALRFAFHMVVALWIVAGTFIVIGHLISPLAAFLGFVTVMVFIIFWLLALMGERDAGN